MRTARLSPKLVALAMLNVGFVACDSASPVSGREGGTSTPNGVTPSVQPSASDDPGTLDASGGRAPNSNQTGPASDGDGNPGSPSGAVNEASAGAGAGVGGSSEPVPTPTANTSEPPVANAGGAAGSAGSGGMAIGGPPGVTGGAPTDAGPGDTETTNGGNGGAAPSDDDEPFTGTCTPSVAVMANASGSGPHEVIVETNSDPGINEGTIFRPADLGGDEKYPIFVWGEGACSQDGLSNATALAEIASHGYFVVADGTPSGSGSRTMDRANLEAMGAPLLAYVDWAIAENDKPCSAYYQSLEPTKVAANGFSCGGLMAQGTVLDPRIVTWGVTSSGMAGAMQDFYDLIHTPVLFVEGGPAEVAYDGAREGFDAISSLDVPVLWFSKDIGHGGDLFQPDGGDFTRINLAWLNWWLKGDETATGKGLLVGAECPYCSDSAWEVMSDDVPE